MKNICRIIAVFIVLGAASAVAALFLPQSVNAQITPVYDNAADLRDRMAEVKAENMKKLQNSWDYAVTMALTQAVNTTAQRVAQTTATWIASGNWGQGSLLFTQEFGSYGKGILLDTASEALNTFSKTAFGFGICEPLNASVSLRIKLGVARVYAPKPTCSFQQFQKAYEGTWNNIESGKLLQNLTASVEMGQSPLSFALNTQFSIADKAAGNKADKLAKMLSSDGFKDLVAPISGNTKTPAEIIKANTENDVIFSPREHEIQTEGAFLNHTEILKDVGANVARVFLSTLTSKILDNYLKKGMVSVFDAACSLSHGEAFDLCRNKVSEQSTAGLTAGGVSPALASAYFASVFAPTIMVIDDFSPAGELVTCPGKDVRGVWNCVIDQGFNSALQPQGATGFLSVREALAKGFLRGDYELIGPNDKRNSDWNCYTQGYCYGNLVKLRRLRIIPVGWEMAAKAAEDNKDRTTLAQAIAKFDDKTSPYYHLIDQDWVLKIPLTQCRAQVSGQTLASVNTKDRADVCVDQPSCISEDADGKCTGGFGYCTREHNSWQIDATACPAQYASCNAFSDPNGKELSVLTNTVEAARCNAGNAGCRPYLAVANAEGKWADSSPAVYLNAKAVECESTGAGCRSLLDIKTATTANLIPNSGFEIPTADGAMASGWTNLGGTYVRDGMNAFDGISVFQIAPSGGLKLGGYNYEVATDNEHYSEVQVEPNTLYTLSFYAKQSGSNRGSLIMKAFDAPFYSTERHACDNSSSTESFPSCLQDMAGDLGYVPTCSTTIPGGAANCNVVDNYEYGYSVPSSAFTLDFPLSPGYERTTMTFSTSSNTRYIDFAFNGGMYLDAVQLEKGATATYYHNGGSDIAGTSVALKVPPEYLGCTGEDSDPAACSGYARVCRQSEVGCDRFIPQDGGNLAITAVASPNNYCNAECVGYNTFKQEATLWMPSIFPVYFIPSTAKSCQLSEVGCDEFTNLQAAAAGGEKKEYFKYVRACRQPDAPNDGNFFTWEGSDTSGFQLKSYTLRVRDDGTGSLMAVANRSTGADTDNYTRNPNAPDNPNGPVYISGTDANACNKGIYAAKTNPDCREFLDADGNIFYRLLSATVTSTSDCITYRKTVSANQASCTGSGGIWDAAAGACNYYVYPSQSLSCNAASNGCRAFTGNKGTNTRTVLTSTFDNNQTDGWSGGVISNESTVVSGQSYQSTQMSKMLNGSPTLSRGRSYTLTLWAKGSGNLNAYLQGANIVPASGRPQYFADASVSAPIALTTEWQRYVLGPVVMDWNPSPVDALTIGASGANTAVYFDNVELAETQDMFALIANSWKTPLVCDQTPAGQNLPQAQLGCAAYENGAGATVNLKSFDHLCRESAVGCGAFADTQGTETQFSSFRNAVCSIAGAADPTNGRNCDWHGKTVCTVDAGQTSCRFSFDGSTEMLAASGNFSYSVVGDTFVIPADKTVYLINDGSDRAVCDDASIGCTALGDNDLNTNAVCTLGAGSGVRPCPAGSSGSNVKCMVGAGQASCTYRVPVKANDKTVYKIIDPAKVDAQLCTAEAVSCQAWKAADGVAKYFKDPGQALCEYKEKSQYNGTEVSGWFKKGTQEPCDPTYVISGTNLGIRRNLDQKFYPAALAGTCPAENALCTEFTDHSDRGKSYNANGIITYEFNQGRPFYYVNDGRIKDASAACNSQVSQKQGCLALDRTDDPRKTMNTLASYALSDSQNFKMVTPVSDGNNDANIILKVTRDRVCSEWLECNSEEIVNDPATGRQTSRCLGLGTCTHKGTDGRCDSWSSLGDSSGELSVAKYTGRVVDSSGNDYAGYSIPGLPSVGDLRQVRVGSIQDPNVPGVNTSTQNYSFIYGLNYGSKNIVSQQTCKIYPETDAPFPKSVLVDPSGPVTGSRKSGFTNVNVCEMNAGDKVGSFGWGIGVDCECSYRKAAYGSLVTKYFPITAESGTRADGTPGEIKGAICSGGAYNGRECWPYAVGRRCEAKDSENCGAQNLSCGVGSGSNATSDGTCVAIDKIDSVLGEQGYCLETDNTLKVNGTDQSACVTWLPVDSIKGKDTANQFASAGFIPKIGQESYCAAPAKYCVPRDCANSSEILPLCTTLKNTKISYAAQSGDQFLQSNGQGPNVVGRTITDAFHSGNCFDACNRGTGNRGLNSTCLSEQARCGTVVNSYCQDYFFDKVSAHWQDPGSIPTDGYSAHCTARVRELPDNLVENEGNRNCKDFNRYYDTVTFLECATPSATCQPSPASTNAYCLAMNTECVAYERALDGCDALTYAATGCYRNNGADDPDCLNAAKRRCKAEANPSNHVASDYCAMKTKRDLSCTTFSASFGIASAVPYCQDIYETCMAHTVPAIKFCNSMKGGDCMGSRYGENAACSHDLPGMYLNDAYAGYAQNPYFNTSSFCGATGYDTAGQATVKDLTQCAASDAQYCGHNNTCAPGSECTALNALSVNQNEFTIQEQWEGYCVSDSAYTFNTYKYCAAGSSGRYPKPVIAYKTKPNLGANTMFGASTSDSKGQYLPLLSANVLKFKLASQDGKWINTYDTVNKPVVFDPGAGGIKIVSGNANNWCTEANSCPNRDLGTPATLGAYPLDFLGLYYFVDSIDVSYDLVSPSILLASQIDRITVKVLSNQHNGLCQYGSRDDGDRTGECYDAGGWYGSTSGQVTSWTVPADGSHGPNGYFEKALFWKEWGPAYGYSYKSAAANIEDDQNFSADNRPSFVILSSANNWSGGLSSVPSGDQGNSMKVELILSETLPKRILGARVSATDIDARGYFYIAGFDVHMRAPICGASTFVGSSSPSAPPSLWPVVYTNDVNNVSSQWSTHPMTNAKGGTINWSTACTPFGAFSASIPQGYVTDSQVQPVSGACEINKGGIAATPTEQQKIFAGVLSVRRMDNGATLVPAWKARPTTGSEPMISRITLNGNAGGAGVANTVTGAGSLRVKLAFAAVADPDHMPIRSVAVDWGDGTDGVDPGLVNHYKNHTAGGDCPDTSFGGHAVACDTSAFEYTHVYSCTTPNRAATDPFPEIGVEVGDPICVFAPTVSVTDNWKATGTTNSATMVKVILAPPGP